MKTLFVAAMFLLGLSMEANASLQSGWSQAQRTDRNLPEAERPNFTQPAPPLLLLSRVYIDLGIHGPIGDHGRFDLYFGSPYRYYPQRPYYRQHPHYRHYPPGQRYRPPPVYYPPPYRPRYVPQNPHYWHKAPPPPVRYPPPHYRGEPWFRDR